MGWRILKQFLGIFTAGDSEDIREESLLRSRNMRPELGLIKKTFGFGAITDPAIAAAVAAGFPHTNMFTFNNDNFLVTPSAYFILSQSFATSIVTVNYFDDTSWKTFSGAELPTLYHKQARNPYFIDNNKVLRILPGAIGAVGANEARGLWVGWIDQKYYNELYSPTAGWHTPPRDLDAPYPYDNEDTAGTLSDFWFYGLGDAATIDESDEYRYIRYSFIYDGVQESLLSPSYATQVPTAPNLIDEAHLFMQLASESAPGVATADIRSNRRITGMRIYLMSNGTDTANAELITEISFIGKADADDDYYGANGLAGYKYLLVENPNNAFATYKTTVTNPGAEDGMSIGGVVKSWFADKTDLGADGILFELETDYTDAGQLFNSPWTIVDHALGAVDSDATNGGYCGKKIFMDVVKDFHQLSPEGLIPIGWTNTGSFYSALTQFVPDTDDLKINAVSKHALKFNGYCVQDGFVYRLGAHPYVFHTRAALGPIYVTNLHVVLDLANTNGASYGLQGAVSIKVNSDYARIIGNRLWQAYSILDPGGENEEQFAAVNYSEAGQLDVMPVSNIIFINDREGGGITGLEELFKRPLVTTRQGVFRINAAFGVDEAKHNIGNLAKNGIISAQGKVYVCWEDGIYALSVNNLAESDATPTENLKVSKDIDTFYNSLTREHKEAFDAKFDQSKGEIVYLLPTGVSFLSEWDFKTVDKWEVSPVGAATKDDFTKLAGTGLIYTFDGTAVSPVPANAVPSKVYSGIKSYAFQLGSDMLLLPRPGSIVTLGYQITTVTPVDGDGVITFLVQSPPIGEYPDYLQFQVGTPAMALGAGSISITTRDDIGPTTAFGISANIAETTCTQGEYSIDYLILSWAIVYAYNPSTEEWREIVSDVDLAMLDIDRNADLLAYQDSTPYFHTVANREAVKGEIFTKFFNLDDEIEQGLRYIQIRYKNESAIPENLVIEIYADGDMYTPIKTITDALPQANAPVTIALEELRVYAKSYAVRIYEVTGNTGSIELHKIAVQEADLI